MKKIKENKNKYNKEGRRLKIQSRSKCEKEESRGSAINKRCTGVKANRCADQLIPIKVTI